MKSIRISAVTWLALLLVMTGLTFRFAGLSHDLDAGYVYHPDTPKQIRAADRFLRGLYFTRIGHSDYDGYPYFNSLLVKTVVQTGEGLHAAWSAWWGVQPSGAERDVRDLFWVTRALNATLASLLLVLVYWTGRRHFGPLAGLAALGMLAFSPADIASCHYATCDTTAAFFAFVSFMFALRIQRDGRWMDYAWGGFFAVCAFASKYHAGMAVIPLLAAHALRYHGRALLTRPALGRLAFLAVIGIGSLFIAIPAMRTHPVETIEDILGFLGHVSSSFRLPEEVREGGVLAKLAFSAQRNPPILLGILGPLPALLFMAALVPALRGRPRYLLLALVPVIYLVVGVSLRPLAHPVYHTLMTPFVFLAAGALLQELWDQRSGWLRWLRPLVPAMALVAVAMLAPAAMREVFFFLMSDTRRIAGEWGRDNIPRDVLVIGSPYSFTLEENTTDLEHNSGIMAVTSSILPLTLPAELKPWARFTLERDALPLFRNPEIDVWVMPSPRLQPDFIWPTGPRLPLPREQTVVLSDLPVLLRDPALWVLPPETGLFRLLVAGDAPEQIGVGVENGPLAGTLVLAVGGERVELSLGPGERRWVEVASPAPWALPFSTVMRFVPVRVRTGVGGAKVSLAVHARDRLIQAWRFGDAEAVLRTARAWPEAVDHPVAASVVRMAADRLAVPLEGDEAVRVEAQMKRFPAVDDRDGAAAVFGIHPDYLESLPYLDLPLEVWRPEEVEAMAGDDAAAQVDQAGSDGLRSAPLHLEPGVYRVVWRSDEATPQEPVPLVLAAENGTVLAGGTVSMAGEVWTMTVPVGAGPVYLEADLGGRGAISGVVVIRPDVMASLDRWRDASLWPADDLPEGWTWEPFHARFRNGLELLGYRMDRTEVAPGERPGIAFSWQVPVDQSVSTLEVWVHLLDAQDRIVAQADHRLVDGLRFPGRPDENEALLARFDLPDDLAPGPYRIRMGLTDGYRDRRVGVAGGGVVELPERLTVRAAP